MNAPEPQLSAPYTLLGWHLSFFSGKTRAYLRYKGVPFHDNQVNAVNLLWRVPRKTGARVMPVVVTPEGQWIQDTKKIADEIERRFPTDPILPDTPVQRIASLLLETWVDEWWIPVAMHYRWSYAENYALFEHDAGAALLPRAPKFIQKRMVLYISNMLRNYLPSVGVVQPQFAVLEKWTETILDHFEKHFQTMPYLFGARPTVADFALNGPMYGHLNRDPMPRRELLDPRPALQNWVERLNDGAQDRGELLADDVVPATLEPIFRAIVNEFLPMILAIRDELVKLPVETDSTDERLPRFLGTVEFPMGNGRYRRKAITYSLWMMQRVQQKFRELDSEGQAAVRQWLATLGARDMLDLDFGPPLRQVDVRVARAK